MADKLPENTAVLLIRGGKEYVLQHRDDIPTIGEPGTYSAWGGRVEPEDTSYEISALRELKEEIGLDFTEADLINLGHGIDQIAVPVEGELEVMTYYFAVELPEGTTFEVYEGQGSHVVSFPLSDHTNINGVTLHAIERYEAR